MSSTEAITKDDCQQQDNIKQYLTFWLGSEVYGIDIAAIKEITSYQDITFVPKMPPFVAGVMNLRGSVVPVISLGERFNNTSTQITKRTSIVIIELFHEDQEMEVGIIVDKVNEVLEINENDIEKPPQFGAKIRTDFIFGMAKVAGKLLVLLSMDNVLSISELGEVSELAADDANHH